MTSRRFAQLSFALLFAALALPAAAVDIEDTRLLAGPAVSADHVAFVYDHDLWVANRDGSDARRLTSHPGDELMPAFSPDGSQVAFSGQYDGNLDVFVVPVEGGVPQRLTWHPGPDMVRGFTPDGEVLFTSNRQVHTFRYTQLFTVPTTGGPPTRLPIPHAAKASYAPDGGTIAYLPLGEAFNQWKNYRGGRYSRIWLYDVGDHSVVEIPQPPGRSNDTDPMWLGTGDPGKVYFLSDRDGEFNLFSYDVASQAVSQLTDHRDFPIVHASAGGGRIVYEQAGFLHLFDPAGGTGNRLPVGVAADLIETRPRYASGASYIRTASLSPSGARAVLEYRGEIVTVPAEKGDPRNLTRSTGVHDRAPVWSPDGGQIAYFSDESGEYKLVIEPQDGRGEPTVYELPGAGFYDSAQWSPDGDKISFSDNSWGLYWIDLAGDGAVKKISSEQVYGPFKTLAHDWSPDSKWLVYTRNTPVFLNEMFLYSLEQDRSYKVTDGLSDVTEPVFDASGKYIWFTASTDAGPARTWFAQSNADIERSNNLYLMVLAADTPSPLAPESDEEKSAGGDEGEDDGEEGDGEEGDGEEDGGDEEGGDEDGEDDEGGTRIDLDGLGQRILALPVGTAAYQNLQAGDDGQLYYLKGELSFASFGGSVGGPPALTRFDLAKREEEKLLDGANGFVLSHDNKKALINTPGGWLISAVGGKVDPSKGRLAVDAIRVRVEPREEWRQIYDEAWRINRDFFYDPGMHGADWPAVRQKYSQFLPHVATRGDLNTVMRWMLSELAVGHHFVGGGDDLTDAESISGGLLGADFEIAEARYRFAKIYGGLNWNPELRSPLTEPGVMVEEGEFLLAVNGEELRPPENLYSRFEATAGRIVELTVGPNADGSESRTVEVVPIENEVPLRNRAWIEGNLKKVDEATDGRVAYVYVPNTGGPGHAYFKRYFFPQADREAVIIDERYNAGGQVADYYIDLLRRPLIAYWATRYGADIKTPVASIQGPKVMLIDETAGSGGDLLPWMFRKFELGTLVGRPTWGGLVGILGFPVLMDGGFVSAPNLGIWTEDGFIVENVGVPPDVEVEMLPKDVIEGRDPQLEKAIEIALEQLEANPPEKPERPPFPIRVWRDGDGN